MPWHTEDLEFDANGDLIIKNKDLAAALEKEICKGKRDSRFRIRIQTDTTGTGGGRPPTNAMCPC